MILPSKVKFANEKTKEAFEKLRDSVGEDKNLYLWLERAFKDIEENAFCGIQIPKKLIPTEWMTHKEYERKFNY